MVFSLFAARWKKWRYEQELEERKSEMQLDAESVIGYRLKTGLISKIDCSRFVSLTYNALDMKGWQTVKERNTVIKSITDHIVRRYTRERWSVKLVSDIQPGEFGSYILDFKFSRK